jgi:hypothetical protein
MPRAKPSLRLAFASFVGIGTLCTGAAGQGSIVHRVLTPPAQVGLPSPEERVTPIDADGDGAVDFTIRTTDFYFDEEFFALDASFIDCPAGVVVLPPNGWGGYNDKIAAAIPLGSTIGPGMTFENTALLCGYFDADPAAAYGPLCSGGGVAGLRLNLSGRTHYGWLRFDFGTPSAPRVEFAYRAEPDVPIQAGATDVPCPPRIEVQPDSTSVGSRSFFLSLVAYGDRLTYQWYKDGDALDGETGPSLSRLQATAQDTGRYYAVVSSPCGSVASNQVEVRIAPGCAGPRPPRGSSLRLFSQGSCVRAAHRPELNVYPITVEAWVRDFSFSRPAVVNKYVSSSFNGYNLYFFEGRIRAWYFRDENNFVWDPERSGRGLDGGPASGDGWRHVAATFDDSGGRIYVDGALREHLGWTGTPGPCTTSQPLAIGHYPEPIDVSYLVGFIDEVRIWNYARSVEQIAGAMNTVVDPASPGLVAYYRFDDETLPVPDLTGNDHSAVAVGNPTFMPVDPCCPADHDGNARVDPDDLSDFIADYFASPPRLRADFDGSGEFNPDDLADFIVAYFTPCP